MSPDYLREKKYTREKIVIKKYNNRVVLLMTNQCPVFCRYCTRKHFIGKKAGRISQQDIWNGIDYIRSRNRIKEVILSGGDPLMLNDSLLENILNAIEKISHINVIRIDSRAPVTWPSRIDSNFIKILAERKIPIWFLTQFNHPKEVTKSSIKACNLIQKKGIPILNQSVILKEVNNDYQTLKSLFEKLITIKVKPYYLYNCDLVEGIGHFVNNRYKSMELIKKIQNSVSGLALPLLVFDGEKKQRYIFNETRENNENWSDV